MGQDYSIPGGRSCTATLGGDGQKWLAAGTSLPSQGSAGESEASGWAWYAGYPLAYLLALIGLAVYGFTISLAVQRVFSEKFLEAESRG